MQRIAARAKPLVRHALDRVARPYVEETVQRLSAPAASAPGAGPAPMPGPFVELHAALHEARSLALADMPTGAQTLLSAGANGKWYFDWVAEEYGGVTQHIGVEAYLPRPEDLPPNARWVEADIASPEGAAAVPSGSVDLVFSGQNLEHLWPDQMLSFLVESNRVLREDGWLVVDSPNRLLTEAYRWSMGEHTVELTPSEAREVLELAGFSVHAMKGLWLCREGHRLLPLEPVATAEGFAATLRRMTKATQRPDDSFIWWAEARKVAAPDIGALAKAIPKIFEEAWAERVARIQVHQGAPVTLPDGQAGVEMASGNPGYSLLGPWMALTPGDYEFETDIMWDEPTPGSGTVARLEVLAGDELLGQVEVPPSDAAGSTRLSCHAVLPEMRFAVHVRLFCTGAARVRAPLALHLRPEPWRERMPDARLGAGE